MFPPFRRIFLTNTPRFALSDPPFQKRSVYLLDSYAMHIISGRSKIETRLFWGRIVCDQSPLICINNPSLFLHLMTTFLGRIPFGYSALIITIHGVSYPLLLLILLAVPHYSKGGRVKQFPLFSVSRRFRICLPQWSTTSVSRTAGMFR